MSSRQQLLHAVHQQPEAVVGQMLQYLDSLPHKQSVEETQLTAAPDYFEEYWSQFYGLCEGEAWAEPVEQQSEVRESW